MAEKEKKSTEGLPQPPPEIVVAETKPKFDWKRVLFILIGIRSVLMDFLYAGMAGCYRSRRKAFCLITTRKGAIALFLLAGVWWVFEVVPIGVTAIAIGVFQAIFAIRSAKDAFRDFMDPSVMFIFASVVIGLAFTKSGLTKRLAYKMLQVVGERTNMIVLGALVVTAGLAHFMAHTAAAATVFPILLAINSLYGEGEKPTKFGKVPFHRDGLCSRCRKYYYLFRLCPCSSRRRYVYSIHGKIYQLFRADKVYVFNWMGHGLCHLDCSHDLPETRKEGDQRSERKSRRTFKRDRSHDQG